MSIESAGFSKVWALLGVVGTAIAAAWAFARGNEYAFVRPLEKKVDAALEEIRNLFSGVNNKLEDHDDVIHENKKNIAVLAERLGSIEKQNDRVEKSQDRMEEMLKEHTKWYLDDQRGKRDA